MYNVSGYDAVYTAGEIRLASNTYTTPVGADQTGTRTRQTAITTGVSRGRRTFGRTGTNTYVARQSPHEKLSTIKDVTPNTDVHV